MILDGKQETEATLKRIERLIQEAAGVKSLEIFAEEIKAGFDPNQKRGKGGKWSKISDMTRLENDISEAANENGGMFDKDGNLIIMLNEGTEDEMNLTQEQLALFKGNILTHNHPEKEGSFNHFLSPTDIRNSFYHEALGIRAVSGDYYSEIIWKTDVIKDSIKNKHHNDKIILQSLVDNAVIWARREAEEIVYKEYKYAENKDIFNANEVGGKAFFDLLKRTNIQQYFTLNYGKR